MVAEVQVEEQVLLAEMEGTVMNTVHSKYETGQLLGSILFEFCCRLHWSSSLYDKKDDALLFMSRGGLRLKFLYELFLKVNGLKAAVSCHPLWLSRFAALKMIFEENPELVVSCLVREFSYTNCGRLAQALLPEQLYPDKMDLLSSLPEKLAEAPVDRTNVFNLYYDSCSYSRTLRKHFAEQHELGHDYLNREFAAFEHLHVVDTGWFGSILGALQTGCRNWNWDALYFGRWNYRAEAPWYFADVIGLFIDAKGFSAPGLNNILLEYHHLLEGVLEPRLPSVEYFTADGKNNAVTDDWPERVAGTEKEEIWQGIKDYFQSRHSLELSAVLKESTCSLNLLKRLIRYPHPAEVNCLLVPDRSADFGKNESTAVISPTVPGCRNYWRTVNRSLWGAGTIAASGKYFIRSRQFIWQILRKCGKIKSAV